MMFKTSFFLKIWTPLEAAHTSFLQSVCHAILTAFLAGFCGFQGIYGSFLGFWGDKIAGLGVVFFQNDKMQGNLSNRNFIYSQKLDTKLNLLFSFGR